MFQIIPKSVWFVCFVGVRSYENWGCCKKRSKELNSSSATNCSSRKSSFSGALSRKWRSAPSLDLFTFNIVIHCHPLFIVHSFVLSINTERTLLVFLNALRCSMMDKLNISKCNKIDSYNRKAAIDCLLTISLMLIWVQWQKSWI